MLSGFTFIAFPHGQTIPLSDTLDLSFGPSVATAFGLWYVSLQSVLAMWCPFVLALDCTACESLCRVLLVLQWDINGQNRFRSIYESYFRGAHGVATQSSFAPDLTFIHPVQVLLWFMTSQMRKVSLQLRSAGSAGLSGTPVGIRTHFWWATSGTTPTSSAGTHWRAASGYVNRIAQPRMIVSSRVF